MSENDPRAIGNGLDRILHRAQARTIEETTGLRGSVLCTGA